MDGWLDAEERNDETFSNILCNMPLKLTACIEAHADVFRAAALRYGTTGWWQTQTAPAHTKINNNNHNNRPAPSAVEEVRRQWPPWMAWHGMAWHGSISWQKDERQASPFTYVCVYYVHTYIHNLWWRCLAFLHSCAQSESESESAYIHTYTCTCMHTIRPSPPPFHQPTYHTYIHTYIHTLYIVHTHTFLCYLHMYFLDAGCN